MRILFAHRTSVVNDRPVETYSRSMVRELRSLGHEVIECGKNPLNKIGCYKRYDLLIDVDCGRDSKGELHWHGEKNKPPVTSVVWLIDSHGWPDMHRRLSKNYDHVFFAVWDKRDLFSTHSSAHWCPNATDLRWFGRDHFTSIKPVHDFGFFGSKGGLDRAIPLTEESKKRDYSVTVRQVAAGGKHRWPFTGQVMSACRNLFNHGQKHDGPNLRVMESMAIGRPLISDQDPRSGMDKLFTPWLHYIPYEAYTYKGLDTAMEFCYHEAEKAKIIAENAYIEVKEKHLIKHRINQLLEVIK